ncbi:hypothetical protein [Undibacterium sp. 5I1]|uniref:hypothetical protein n=1 Tax=Undibacterium sp. 5I1 TaxID=3048590 RepID=UPI002B2240E1|nr:hypothetical protein [Undibacterium sp. 5I1]
MSTDTTTISIESSFFPNQKPKIHLVCLKSNEAQEFAKGLAARPFGSNKIHIVFLNSLTSNGTKQICTIFICSEGSRHRQKIEICADTYEYLKRILDSNIISDGFVDD